MTLQEYDAPHVASPSPQPVIHQIAKQGDTEVMQAVEAWSCPSLWLCLQV